MYVRIVLTTFPQFSLQSCIKRAERPAHQPCSPLRMASLPRQAYTFVQPGSVYFRGPTEDDLDAVYALESSSYPADEAATKDKLLFRIHNAPDAFLVMLQAADGSPGDKLIGYVCGTRTHSKVLTHESMSQHEPEGSLLCIHSVVVAPSHQRRGLATKLLKTHLQLVAATQPDVQEVRLLCKQHLVPLYARAGFQLLGPSPVQHDADQWLEMVWQPCQANAAAAVAAAGMQISAENSSEAIAS